MLLTSMWVQAATVPMCYNPGYFSKQKVQLLKRSSLFPFTAIYLSSASRKVELNKTEQRAGVDEFFSAHHVHKTAKRSGFTQQHPFFVFFFFREANVGLS